MQTEEATAAADKGGMMELVVAVQDLIFVLKLGMGMVASLCIIRVYVLLSQL